VADLIWRYQTRVSAERVRPPGFTWRPPLQVAQQALEATNTLDDANGGVYIRGHSFVAVVGDVKSGAKGEWAHSREP